MTNIIYGDPWPEPLDSCLTEKVKQLHDDTMASIANIAAVSNEWPEILTIIQYAPHETTDDPLEQCSPMTYGVKWNQGKEQYGDYVQEFKSEKDRETYQAIMDLYRDENEASE